MKKFSGITSVESKASFRERMVEKFVKNNLPPVAVKENKISGMGRFAGMYKEIEYCAAELPVNGCVDILVSPVNASGIKRISAPVTSRFIVFCTREDDSDYKVSCSCSLS